MTQLKPSYLSGPLRASIKLLIKTPIAIIDVSIITETLAIPVLSDLPIAPVNGFMSPRSITNVRITAICARTRFPFLNPGVIITRIIPPKTGIKAVTDGCSELKYAQAPREIKTMAFSKLIKYGFIIIAFNLTKTRTAR
jgi:hypothetical protein